MAIFNLLNIIMQYLYEKKLVCAIYTDRTKAFDNVNHLKLLKNLDECGIRGNILKSTSIYFLFSMESYLSVRVCISKLLEFVQKVNVKK